MELSKKKKYFDFVIWVKLPVIMIFFNPSGLSI